jgi:stage II sporulation protein R
MGYYTSLRIIIGSGEGKNWWCVMFPPMCIESATETVNYTDEEELLIKNKYTVKFKLLEVISKLMKK